MLSKNYKLFGFLFLILLFFSSCKTAMLYTTLDILRPAQVEFDADVNNILIVNNSTLEFIESDYIDSAFETDSEKYRFLKDSIAIYILSVLTQELEETDFFNSVDLQLNLPENKTDPSAISPLQFKDVLDLCEKYDADAILSLDYISLTHEFNLYYTYIGAMTLFYETLWSIHYPDKIETTAVHFKDSLSWIFNRSYTDGTITDLPEAQDAIIDAALLTGQNSFKRFIPYWDAVDRYFYDSKDIIMKQGMDSVYVKNWQAAVQLWSKVYNTTKKPKLKAEAANNIAIVYEILGNYDMALEYINISFDIFITRLSTSYDDIIRLSEYANELYRRKDEVLLLNKQLGK